MDNSSHGCAVDAVRRRQPLLMPANSAAQWPQRCSLLILVGLLCAFATLATRGLRARVPSPTALFAVPGWPGQSAAVHCGGITDPCDDAAAEPKVMHLETTMRALKQQLGRLSAGTVGEIKKTAAFASSERSHLEYVDQV